MKIGYKGSGMNEVCICGERKGLLVLFASENRGLRANWINEGFSDHGVLSIWFISCGYFSGRASYRREELSSSPSKLFDRGLPWKLCFSEALYDVGIDEGNNWNFHKVVPLLWQSLHYVLLCYFDVILPNTTYPQGFYWLWKGRVRKRRKQGDWQYCNWVRVYIYRMKKVSSNTFFLQPLHTKTSSCPKPNQVKKLFP